MPYRIAGIDVHKRMLAVVVSAVEIDGEYNFERRQLGRNPAQQRWLAEWRIEPQVEEVVMESTAQYWKPGALPRREHGPWRRRNRTGHGGGARTTSPTPSVW